MKLVNLFFLYKNTEVVGIANYKSYQKNININKGLINRKLTLGERKKLTYYLGYYKINYYKEHHMIEYFIYFILNQVLYCKTGEQIEINCCFNNECYSLAINSTKYILTDRYPHLKLSYLNNKLTINNF